MSSPDHANLLEVLRAAKAVLEAREDQMLTSEEWDALAQAVAAATSPVQGKTGVTKRDLLRLFEPYAPDEPIVFVAFDDGIVVHERIEVAKDHCTTYTASDGSVSMPIAIYLVDDGKRGRGSVMGLDPKGILPEGWPRLSDERCERDEAEHPDHPNPASE
jgi:hypothetical protein